MKSKQWFGQVLLGIFFLVFGTVAQGQQAWQFPDFTATQVFSSRNADVTMKVYRSGSSVRVEHSKALSTLYVTATSTAYNLTVYPDKSRQCVAQRFPASHIDQGVERPRAQLIQDQRIAAVSQRL